MTNSNIQHTPAQAQYAAHQTSLRDLIKQLEAKLDQHQVQASTDATNWGYAGQLGYANAKLTELVASFR